MAKYSKFTDQDYHVKSFRWPYWLLPLLFLSLILVLGLFIFITIHSADRFGCLFHCEQKIDNGGVEAPEEIPFSSRRDQNASESVSTRKPPGTDNDVVMVEPTNSTQKSPSQDMITVKGKLFFPSNRVPDSIPPHSHLIVQLEDTSMQDSAAVVLAKTLVDVSKYKKGTDLTYKIEYAKPTTAYGELSISAVLNMGWSPTKKDEWLRDGDFLTVTMYSIVLENNVTVYEKDVTFSFNS